MVNEINCSGCQETALWAIKLDIIIQNGLPHILSSVRRSHLVDQNEKYQQHGLRLVERNVLNYKVPLCNHIGSNIINIQ